MKELLSTKEVAELLHVNEKMVYTLISEKQLPATKVTGKWLFPRRLVEMWLEDSTINRPPTPATMPRDQGLLVIAGSNDILLERTISLFNHRHPDYLAVYGNVGSLGGLRALRGSLCQIAASHLLQETDGEYNFQFAEEELGERPAAVNFCLREQCLLVANGNPKNIQRVADLGRSDIRIVNRPEGTGTRLLLDMELRKAGIDGKKIEGYGKEFQEHLAVGLEVLAGRADAAPAVTVVAGLLGLDFVPLRKERFDLLIPKGRFFDHGVQLFLGLLHDESFRSLAQGLEGYDMSLCGKMVFPHETGIGK